MSGIDATLSMFFGGWEIVLILTVVILLFAAKPLLALRGRDDRDAGRMLAGIRNDFVVWVAEGLGVGRIPWAPGTFGSVAGLGWFALLVLLGDWRVSLGGLVLGLAASVWFCGGAERITGRKDPGSVVLDEIVAMPICFIPWVWAEHAKLHAMPGLEAFFGARTWMFSLAVFGLFRLFDIWKPWPIRPSQNLPGGWGVTIDDVLAAVAVAVVSLAFLS